MVGPLRRLTGTRRIGHAGTLDPLASGVLPDPRRRRHPLQRGADRRPEAIRGRHPARGAAAPTDDAEGPIPSGRAARSGRCRRCGCPGRLRRHLRAAAAGLQRAKAGRPHGASRCPRRPADRAARADGHGRRHRAARVSRHGDGAGRPDRPAVRAGTYVRSSRATSVIGSVAAVSERPPPHGGSRLARGGRDPPDRLEALAAPAGWPTRCCRRHAAAASAIALDRGRGVSCTARTSRSLDGSASTAASPSSTATSSLGIGVVEDGVLKPEKVLPREHVRDGDRHRGVPAIGPAAITLGAFDGVHLGHRHLARRDRRGGARSAAPPRWRSSSRRTPTRSSDPGTVVERLLLPDAHARAPGCDGLDHVVPVRFDEALRSLARRNFLAALAPAIQPRAS